MRACVKYGAKMFSWIIHKSAGIKCFYSNTRNASGVRCRKKIVRGVQLYAPCVLCAFTYCVCMFSCARDLRKVSSQHTTRGFKLSMGTCCLTRSNVQKNGSSFFFHFNFLCWASCLCQNNEKLLSASVLKKHFTFCFFFVF